MHAQKKRREAKQACKHGQPEVAQARGSSTTKKDQSLAIKGSTKPQNPQNETVISCHCAASWVEEREKKNAEE